MGYNRKRRQQRWLAAAAKVAVPVAVAGIWCVSSFADPDVPVVDGAPRSPADEQPTEPHVLPYPATLSEPSSPFEPGSSPGFNSPHSNSHEPDETEHSGRYSFLGVDEETDGRAPFRWDPCTPIRYKTNFAKATQVQVETFRQALSVVAAATGLTFENVGSFTEGRNGFNDVDGFDVEEGHSIGSHDAFFGVYTRYDDPVLNGRMALASATWRTSADGSQWIVHGYAALMENPWWANDSQLSRQVWLHEIGHLVGLGHVRDKEAVMNPNVLESNPDFGPGDLKGLQAVGSEQGCRSDT